MIFCSRPRLGHNEDMDVKNKKTNCYCAFCRTPRKVYYKKSVSVANVIYSAIAAIPFMYLLWQGFDPRVVVVFVVCIGLTEVFMKLRWRLALQCQQCGFDPVLYRRDPESASQKVKAHLEKRAQDPKYLLARPLNLPKLPAVKAEALQSKGKGKLVSRTL